MTQDALKLVAYIGERHRVNGKFVADELLDLFGNANIASSALFRGSGGFGLKHHLRTDQSLTMSEDPPVAALAVDTERRIESVVADVRRTTTGGLVTLERARLLRDDLSTEILPDAQNEATKLTIYVGRQERIYRVPAFIGVCDLLHRRSVAGASVLLGVDGTFHGRRERARFFDRNSDVPVMITAVGTGPGIARVLPELGALLRRPLVTLERVRVCKRDGILLQRPRALPAVDRQGRPLWQKMMVYTSESALHHGRPIHREIIRRLRHSRRCRGVTALRGIWGFHGDHAPHGDRLFQLGRHVPVMTILVDTPENIAASFDVIDDLTTEHGLVTVETVPALTEGEDTQTGAGPMILARDSF